MPEATVEAYETLMQFLYRAPIGLVQVNLDGDVEMINPMAASLLMPLSRAANLDNLFLTLGEVAPQLRELVAAFGEPSGSICESMRIPLVVGDTSMEPQTLSLSLVKLDAARFMAMDGAYLASRGAEGAAEAEAARTAVAQRRLMCAAQARTSQPCMELRLRQRADA